jgi:replication-associated recombination protein RarA
MMIFEKYRPQNWDELAGQEKAVKTVRRIIERPGFDRGAFWIECAGDNNSGVGKTSLAWLIARHFADDFFVTAWNGARLDKAAVHKIEMDSQLSTWGEKRFRAVIVDESHAISQGAVDALLPFLEALPRHFVIIFTTTRAVDRDLFGDDSGPFASRCFQIRLTNQGICRPMAERVKWIAEQEGLDGKPVETYVKLLQTCKNNMRMALQRVEAGEMLD